MFSHAARRHFPAILLSAVAAFAVHGSATAAGIIPVDALNVAGVKLGMTADEVVAALKKTKPDYVIAKRYSREAYKDDIYLGDDVQQKEGKNFLNGIAAMDPANAANGYLLYSKLLPKPGWPVVTNDGVKYNYDAIKINLSPLPINGAQRVIGIVENSIYLSSIPQNLPNNGDLEDTLSDHYGDPKNATLFGDKLNAEMIYDENNILLNKSQASSRHLNGLNMGKFDNINPQKPNQNRGVSVSYSTESFYNALYVNVALYDRGALADAFLLSGVEH